MSFQRFSRSVASNFWLRMKLEIVSPTASAHITLQYTRSVCHPARFHVLHPCLLNNEHSQQIHTLKWFRYSTFAVVVEEIPLPYWIRAAKLDRALGYCTGTNTSTSLYAPLAECRTGSPVPLAIEGTRPAITAWYKFLNYLHRGNPYRLGNFFLEVLTALQKTTTNFSLVED